MDDLDPLHSEDPEAWDRLLRALGLPALIVAAGERLGPRLRGRVDPQDIVQDALFQLWRRRESLEWRGVKAFRALLVEAMTGCILDLAKKESTIKRSGVEIPIGSEGDSEDGIDPAISTTPSRIATASETARRMTEALQQIEEPTRSVVRQRLFEERSTDEVSAELNISVSQVKHLLRKGKEDFRRLLGSEEE